MGVPISPQRSRCSCSRSSIVVPVTLLGRQLVTELGTGLAALQDQFASGGLQRRLESHPLLAQMTSMIERAIDVRAIVGNVASWLTNLGGSFVRESLSHLLTALLTFYLLYYFLRDRRAARRQVKIYSPLAEHETDRSDRTRIRYDPRCCLRHGHGRRGAGRVGRADVLAARPP